MPKVNPDKLVKVEIFVTDARIKKGVINDSESCPVALGLKAVTKKNVVVDAGYDELVFTLDLGHEINDFDIPTPARVSKFMEKFDDLEDDDARPKAFSFKVKIPNRFLKPSFQE